MFLSGSKNYRIKQLLPPDGWRAIFANSDCTNWFWSPLIAWALCEKYFPDIEELDSKQVIVGIVSLDEMGGEMAIAPELEEFIGYLESVEREPTISKKEIQSRLEVIKEMREEKEAEREAAKRGLDI